MLEGCELCCGSLISQKLFALKSQEVAKLVGKIYKKVKERFTSYNHQRYFHKIFAIFLKLQDINYPGEIEDGNDSDQDTFVSDSEESEDEVVSVHNSQNADN